MLQFSSSTIKDANYLSIYDEQCLLYYKTQNNKLKPHNIQQFHKNQVPRIWHLCLIEFFRDEKKLWNVPEHQRKMKNRNPGSLVLFYFCFLRWKRTKQSGTLKRQTIERKSTQQAQNLILAYKTKLHFYTHPLQSKTHFHTPVRIHHS